MTDRRIAELEALAGLRADRSAARLARFQTAIATLEGRAAALRDQRAEAPVGIAEAVMRDRWDRWRGEQVRSLGQQLARLQAVAQPQREAHTRDRARRLVLEKLARGQRR